MGAPWECADCGRSHPRGCHGHVRRCNQCSNPVGKKNTTCRKCKSTDIDERAPCREKSKIGMTVCWRHGGNSPQAERAAERREQHAAAVDAMETLGLPVTVDPHVALLEEVHRTAGHVAWLGELVQSLEQDELKQYTTDDDGRHWERPSIWIEMYQRERKQLVTVARAAIAAGVAERQVQIAEQQGAAIVSVIRAVLVDLGRDDEEAHGIVARHLRLVQAVA